MHNERNGEYSNAILVIAKRALATAVCRAAAKSVQRRRGHNTSYAKDNVVLLRYMVIILPPRYCLPCHHVIREIKRRHACACCQPGTPALARMPPRVASERRLLRNVNTATLHSNIAVTAGRMPRIVIAHGVIAEKASRTQHAHALRRRHMPLQAEVSGG